ncbi:hypothetical protein G9A89_021744 [Geosiphon pyriformis]|nr:hypothetical protein G9A89_021744 [Geosiphon pyriformis]
MAQTDPLRKYAPENLNQNQNFTGGEQEYELVHKPEKTHQNRSSHRSQTQPSNSRKNSGYYYNRDHTRPQHPLPEGNGDICVQDHYSIIFNTYGIAQTIEEYVLLFIMVADVEEPAQLPKFFTIRDILDECCQEGYIEMESNKLMKDLLQSYAKARKQNDENKRNQIMEYIFQNLRVFGVIKNWKSFHNDYLSKVRISETRCLRWICLQRILAFRSFGHVLKGKKKSKSILNEFKDIKDYDDGVNDLDLLHPATTNIFNKSNFVQESKQSENISESSIKARSEIENLQKKVHSLDLKSKEASSNATPISWKDDDPNNTVQLTKDIENLQNLVRDFTKVRGSNFKLNSKNCQKLLQAFNCEAQISSFKGKTAVSFALQGLTIMTIQDAIQKYYAQNQNIQSTFDNSGNLEVSISSTVDSLIGLMEKYSSTLIINDEFAKMAPIKVRQQVYAVLGSHAFSDQNQPFFKKLTRIILEKIENYREILSEEYKAEFPSQAAEVIRQVICIFLYRINTQEQIPQIKFFGAGTPLDSGLMEGSWDYENGVVDICGFPAIGIYLDNPTKRRIICKAIVLAKSN